MSDMDMRGATWLTVERLSIILGMLAMAFMAGANWHRIDGLDSAVVGLSRQQDSIKAEYERKDVLALELKNVNEKLEDIKQRIDAARLQQP